MPFNGVLEAVDTDVGMEELDSKLYRLCRRLSESLSMLLSDQSTEGLLGVDTLGSIFLDLKSS